MHPPHDSHMEAIYRILRYLKSTLGKEILFQNIKNGNLISKYKKYRIGSL